MYKLISLISAFIRQFLLPNPYINFFDNEAMADLFNIIIGGAILHSLSFLLTKCGYEKGIDDPASGSLGYLISYCYLTTLITGLGYFISNITVFIIIFSVIYIASCVITLYIFKIK